MYPALALVGLAPVAAQVDAKLFGPNGGSLDLEQARPATTTRVQMVHRGQEFDITVCWVPVCGSTGEEIDGQEVDTTDLVFLGLNQIMRLKPPLA